MVFVPLLASSPALSPGLAPPLDLALAIAHAISFSFLVHHASRTHTNHTNEFGLFNYSMRVKLGLTFLEGPHCPLQPVWL